MNNFCSEYSLLLINFWFQRSRSARSGFSYRQFELDKIRYPTFWFQISWLRQEIEWGEREKVQKVPIFIESWCTPFDVLKNWSGAFLENLVYGWPCFFVVALTYLALSENHTILKWEKKKRFMTTNWRAVSHVISQNLRLLSPWSVTSFDTYQS